MEIGVQTKGIIEPDKDMEKGYHMIREAGFTRVDFNLDVFLQNYEVYEGKLNAFFDMELDQLLTYFGEHKKAMDAAGLCLSQMHAPYPVRVPGNLRATAYMQCEVLPKSIVIAQLLEAPWVVVHPFKMQYTHGRQREYLENFNFFKVLIPLLKERHVRICFENLYENVGGRIVEGVCADPWDAVWYVDNLNAEAGEELFGMCLDTGHLQLAKRDAYEYITTIGSRLKILHLHENNGIGDLHEMPFSYGCAKRAGFDWEGAAKGLAGIGFDGTLSFETFPCMNAFPELSRPAVLKVLHEIGAYLAERIASYQMM